MTEDFNFEEWRERFPLHWDQKGWPSKRSTWRFRDQPQMRVQVVGCDVTDVQANVYWDGSLDELEGLFSYENTDRWAIDKQRLVSRREASSPGRGTGSTTAHRSR